MMDQPVAYTGFVNIARLWIINLKSMVLSMAIGFIGKVAMKRQDVVHQVDREFPDIFSLPFSRQEFPPGGKQIIKRYDIIVIMAKPFYSLSLSLSRKCLDSPANQRGIFDLAEYCSAYSQRLPLYHRLPNWKQVSRSLGALLHRLFYRARYKTRENLGVRLSSWYAQVLSLGGLGGKNHIK